MVEQAQEQESVEGKPEAEEEAPKPKARAKRGSIQELQAKKDREVAEARKAMSEAQAEREDLMSQLRSLQAHNKMLEEVSAIGDQSMKLKQLAAWEEELGRRDAKNQSYEKILAMRHISNEYGIPEDELEIYDNPKDMKIAALEWSIAHNKASEVEVEEPAAVEEEPEEEPTGASPLRRNNFDTSSGGTTRKSFLDMPSEDFWAEKKRMEAARRRDDARQRRR